MIKIQVQINGVSALVDRDILPLDKDGREITKVLDEIVDGKYVVDSEALAIELEALALIEAKKVRADKMLEGATYSLNEVDYQISFTKEDGDGLVQVKSAFELGLTQTIIHFSNGTELPISPTEFAEFASWFVNKRNEFF